MERAPGLKDPGGCDGNLCITSEASHRWDGETAERKQRQKI